MDDNDKYLIKVPKQILSYLRLLSQERCLISVAFGDQERHTFLTVILAINDKKQHITLDFGPQDYLNKRLLGSALIRFSTEYQGVKVRFDGRNIKQITYSGQPAFSVTLPSSLYWLQRRQFYRVKLPLSRKSYCTLSLLDPETEQKVKVNFPIYDLSAVGFSFLSESSLFLEQLKPTTEFNRCNLVLDENINLNVSISICYKTIQNPDKDDSFNRVGCYIINTTPRTESAILRYMQDIEREIKHKKK